MRRQGRCPGSGSAVHRGSPLLQGVTGQVDECLHVVLCAGDGDDRATVGVADQDDRTGYLADDGGDVGGVPYQAAVGNGRGDHVEAAGDQPGNDLCVAGGVSECAVHENDGRLVGIGHGKLPHQWGGRLSRGLSAGSGLPWWPLCCGVSRAGLEIGWCAMCTDRAALDALPGSPPGLRAWVVSSEIADT